jgi:hypothetical protein
MPGYSGTPLWKKLGYKDALLAYVEAAPRSYVRDLELPRDVRVTWAKRATAGISFVHLFAIKRQVLATKLQSFRRLLAPAGVIWISWPKKTSGVATDITEDVVRQLALPLGLVDIKVCAVDHVWSGLKLMIRKELR